MIRPDSHVFSSFRKNPLDLPSQCPAMARYGALLQLEMQQNCDIVFLQKDYSPATCFGAARPKLVFVKQILPFGPKFDLGAGFVLQLGLTQGAL
ncbi:MAG: hypothetical protein U5N55_07315 [Cypionkella sp.]|nr:hypothetical protein [Cypionkella sp.]